MSSIGIIVDLYGPAAPLLGTHAIHGLIANFNNNRVKFYQLHVFKFCQSKHQVQEERFSVHVDIMKTKLSSRSRLFELERSHAYKLKSKCPSQRVCLLTQSVML